MRREEIVIRDPYVLVYGDTYYLYGTRSFTCWEKSACGTDVYISKDLKEWSEPIEVFHKPEGYWGEYLFWAPEVHEYRGAFYMFMTFGSDKQCKGTAILKADRPEGPFVVHSKGSVTRPDWECLDGTFHVAQDGTPYMIFCHEWVQVGDGQILAVQLKEDLTGTVGEPKLLFTASQGKPWVVSLAFGEQDPKKKAALGGAFVTDGPFAFRTSEGRLGLLWSSFSEEGYTESMAWSDNGEIDGNWTVDEELLFRKDGGHGMIFRDMEGQLMISLHAPNTRYVEHPVFSRLEEAEGRLRVAR